eukprot:SAG22_NODE_97_length_20760_cov_43.302850_5_plen_1902_part_00
MRHAMHSIHNRLRAKPEPVRPSKPVEARLTKPVLERQGHLVSLDGTGRALVPLAEVPSIKATPPAPEQRPLAPEESVLEERVSQRPIVYSSPHAAGTDGPEPAAAALIPYLVTVVTGDVLGAGTDANVEIGISGETAASETLSLQTGAGRPFERGHCDEFRFMLTDLGDLTHIDVSYDGAGIGSAWYLEKIVVAAAGGHEWVFWCRQFLNDDRPNCRLLLRDEPPPLAGGGGGGGGDGGGPVVLLGPTTILEYARQAVEEGAKLGADFIAGLDIGEDGFLDNGQDAGEPIVLHHRHLATNELLDDRATVLAAVQVHGAAIKFAENRYHDDKEIMLAAVAQNGRLLREASANLRNDKDVVVAAVQQFGQALAFADESLKADKAVVLAAVKQDGWAAYHADPMYKGDMDVAEAVVSSAVPRALQHMDCDLLLLSAAGPGAGENLLTAALSKDGSMLSEEAFPPIGRPEKWRAEAWRRFVMAAVGQNGSALQFAGAELQADYEVIAVAVCQSAVALEFVADAVQFAAADLDMDPMTESIWTSLSFRNQLDQMTEREQQSLVWATVMQTETQSIINGAAALPADEFYKQMLALSLASKAALRVQSTWRGRRARNNIVNANRASPKISAETNSALSAATKNLRLLDNDKEDEAHGLHLFEVACTHLGNGELDEAQQAFQGAIDHHHPHPSRCHNGLGLVQLGLENELAAISCFTDAIAADTNDYRALHNRAETYKRLGRYKDAAGDAEKAAVLNLNRTTSETTNQLLSMTIAHRAAQKLQAIYRGNVARRAEQAAKDSELERVDADEVHGLHLFEVACTHLGNGELDEAQQAFQGAIDHHHPHPSRCHNGLGLVQLGLKNDNQLAAISCFTDAIAADTNDYRALHNRAEAYKRLGRYKEAAGDAEKAAALSLNRTTSETTNQLLSMTIAHRAAQKLQAIYRGNVARRAEQAAKDSELEDMDPLYEAEGAETWSAAEKLKIKAVGHYVHEANKAYHEADEIDDDIQVMDDGERENESTDSIKLCAADMLQEFDLMTVEKVFTACDTDGSGEIDMQELSARYGKQARHLLLEFDLDQSGSIDKDEFVTVLRDKYLEKPERTSKWIQFLAQPPRGKAKKQREKEAAETEAWLEKIELGAAEAARVEAVASGELLHLHDNPEDMATVKAVFAACDADGNGEVDEDELIARYGKQAGHLLRTLDLDSGGTITLDEFVTVLDQKFIADPRRTSKWLAWLAQPPRGKTKQYRQTEAAIASTLTRDNFRDGQHRLAEMQAQLASERRKQDDERLARLEAMQQEADRASEAEARIRQEERALAAKQVEQAEQRVAFEVQRQYRGVLARKEVTETLQQRRQRALLAEAAAARDAAEAEARLTRQKHDGPRAMLAEAEAGRRAAEAEAHALLARAAAQQDDEAARLAEIRVAAEEETSAAIARAEAAEEEARAAVARAAAQEAAREEAIAAAAREAAARKAAEAARSEAEAAVAAAVQAQARSESNLQLEATVGKAADEAVLLRMPWLRDGSGGDEQMLEALEVIDMLDGLNTPRSLKPSASGGYEEDPAAAREVPGTTASAVSAASADSSASFHRPRQLRGPRLLQEALHSPHNRLESASVADAGAIPPPMSLSGSSDGIQRGLSWSSDELLQVRAPAGQIFPRTADRVSSSPKRSARRRRSAGSGRHRKQQSQPTSAGGRKQDGSLNSKAAAWGRPTYSADLSHPKSPPKGRPPAGKTPAYRPPPIAVTTTSTRTASATTSSSNSGGVDSQRARRRQARAALRKDRPSSDRATTATSATTNSRTTKRGGAASRSFDSVGSVAAGGRLSRGGRDGSIDSGGAPPLLEWQSDERYWMYGNEQERRPMRQGGGSMPPPPRGDERQCWFERDHDAVLRSESRLLSDDFVPAWVEGVAGT